MRHNYEICLPPLFGDSSHICANCLPIVAVAAANLLAASVSTTILVPVDSLGVNHLVSNDPS